jgi:hypothetical protein
MKGKTLGVFGEEIFSTGSPGEGFLLEEVFFPFIEWIQKSVPLFRGVLTFIRPPGSAPFHYRSSPFSGYHLIASFYDSFPEEEKTEEQRFDHPGIYSLVHLTTGFLLNLLVVEYRKLQENRGGLVLESHLQLSGNWWQNALYQIENKGVIPRLFIAFHPHLIPPGWGGVILEGYRTLSQNQQVKFYFRWGGKV